VEALTRRVGLGLSAFHLHVRTETGYRRGRHLAEPRRRLGPDGPAERSARGYWSPRVRDELARSGVTFLAPFQSRKADPDPDRSRRLARVRWVIETAFGQLAERFRLKRTWARDLWHLSHRVIRKVLSHTAAIRINLAAGRTALNFDGLVVG
jgi:Transposase DDE domain